ncbi:hypothetical protein Syun_016838 [Stephania yunnanensis]|uniref:Uncharacterized protein n=1 Tax=Stephania yunnanensis TaxID=152371 RepID=A0AAP0J853_9MAGN
MPARSSRRDDHRRRDVDGISSGGRQQAQLQRLLAGDGGGGVNERNAIASRLLCGAAVTGAVGAKTPTARRDRTSGAATQAAMTWTKQQQLRWHRRLSSATTGGCATAGPHGSGVVDAAASV